MTNTGGHPGEHDQWRRPQQGPAPDARPHSDANVGFPQQPVAHGTPAPTARVGSVTGTPPKPKLLGSKRAKSVAGGIATVLLAALTVVVTYLLAPSQEVASQQAVEEYQRLQDAENAPVSIEDIYGHSEDRERTNVASVEVVDLDGKAIPSGGESGGEDPAQLLPSPVMLGDALRTLTSGAKARVDFTLTGRQNSPARIRDIRVRVTERNAAPRGTLVFYPPQGSVPDLNLGFDLDSADTSARTLDDDGMPTSNHYFRENTVTLGKGEALGFNTIVMTKECACKYVLEIEFGDGRTLQIDNNGSPFFLAAYRDDSERIYTPQYRQSATGSSGEPVLTRCPSMAACAQIAFQQAAS